MGFSPVHNAERLPKVFREMERQAREKGDYSVIGHNGSHFFCVDDFVRAVVSGKIPPINAWNSAIYTITGILAHESAMNGSKIMKLPDIGEIPKEKELLNFD
mgnify:CR=1 FL=1